MRAGRQAILAVVWQIPLGQVASYGQVARLAGWPGAARQVGYALHDLPPGSEVPWHRVVNVRGELSLARSQGDSASEQKRRLLDEGVNFDDNGRVCMQRHRWRGEGEAGLLR